MKTRKKRSIIWCLNQQEFSELCKTKSSLAEILRYFNLHVGAGNYKTLKNRIKEEKIDINHISIGLDSNKNRKFPQRRKTKEEVLSNIFIKGSRIKGPNLKAYAKRFDLLKQECLCGQGEQWNGKKLVLQLDHINGDSSDNQILNLRLLCPNCHSQTDTFAGRNINSRKEFTIPFRED